MIGSGSAKWSPFWRRTTNIDTAWQLRQRRRRRRLRRPGVYTIESRTEKPPFIGLASLTGMITGRRRFTATMVMATEMLTGTANP